MPERLTAVEAEREETAARVKDMVTDPARMKRTDPGNPDICNVFSMHKIFSPQDAETPARGRGRLIRQVPMITCG